MPTYFKFFIYITAGIFISSCTSLPETLIKKNGIFLYTPTQHRFAPTTLWSLNTKTVTEINNSPTVAAELSFEMFNYMNMRPFQPTAKVLLLKQKPEQPLDFALEYFKSELEGMAVSEKPFASAMSAEDAIKSGNKIAENEKIIIIQSSPDANFQFRGFQGRSYFTNKDGARQFQQAFNATKWIVWNDKYPNTLFLFTLNSDELGELNSAVNFARDFENVQKIEELNKNSEKNKLRLM